MYISFSASYLSSAETRATGSREKGGVAAQAESLADQNKASGSGSGGRQPTGSSTTGNNDNNTTNFEEAKDRLVPKMENEPQNITQQE